MTWNPEYVAYAASLGLRPDEALRHDHEEYPGGSMAGFIVWIGQLRRLPEPAQRQSDGHEKGNGT